MKVVVVGAQPGSLGQRIAELLAMRYEVITWGINDEQVVADLTTTPMGMLRAELARLEPQHIICTAGVNKLESNEEDPYRWYDYHFGVNCIGPMRLLQAWLDVNMRAWSGRHRHFVAISSNSAHVPRSGSAAYCASKAALSQAIRCKARELGGGAEKMVVYGYEPGLVAGTPMTAQTAQYFPGLPLTRMRGEELAHGVSRSALAAMVMAGLRSEAALNGCLIPFDAGER